jgi:hypothetical protein
MRPTHNYILALAFVSFLTITLTGFHLHADVGEHEAVASHTHDLHQHATHDLSFESDHVDVSVFEPARGFAHVEAFIPSARAPELAATPIVDSALSKYPPIVVPRHYERLRPSLRAPPISA